MVGIEEGEEIQVEGTEEKFPSLSKVLEAYRNG